MIAPSDRGDCRDITDPQGCRTIVEAGGYRWHRPGCIGCSVYGHRQGCTCPRKSDASVTTRRRLDSLDYSPAVLEAAWMGW